MDFIQAFINSLHTSTSLTKSISLLDYLPTAVSPQYLAAYDLPYLQAYGRIAASYPYYYDLSGLDSYCLLYTENGMGNLIIDNKSQALTPNTLAFIDCRKRHRIDIKQSQWSYIVFFINGAAVSTLYNIILSDESCIVNFSSDLTVPKLIKNFMKQLTLEGKSSLLHTKIILDLLLEIAIDKEIPQESSSHIPDYLTRIRYNFDAHFQEDYSLDLLEKEYHISKFRICREFTRHYEVSPFQYLNSKRIDAAKEALIYTDNKIYEIGRLVGFENTNLFIRLFKKHTGTTPLHYRKNSSPHTLFR